MARMKGNNAAEGLSGRVCQFVYKKYGDRTIVSKVPDMSRRKLSEKQREANTLFKMANHWATYVLKDPEKYAWYCSIATGGKTARNMAISDYMRMYKEGKDPWLNERM
jgi:hypothetical protein